MPVVSIRAFPGRSITTPPPGKVFVGVSLKAGQLPRRETLQEVFRWTQENLGSFALLLGDRLNRHNYAAFDHMPEDAAESKATAEGDSAAASLKHLIERSSAGAAPVLRASELVRTPHYPEHHRRLVQSAGGDARFRDFIQQGVDVFMTRNSVPPALRKGVEPYCIAYQMEELAIFEILAGMGYSTLVYPGAHLPVMKAFASGQLTNISRGLEAMNLIEIRVHGGSKCP